MSSRRRGSTDLARRRQTRRERLRLLVVAEGEETEPEYFRGLAKFLRATGVDVQGVHVYGTGRDPLRIVNEAAGRAGLVPQNRETEDYDQVWCVVDVDEHTTLEPACTLAVELGISLAV